MRPTRVVILNQYYVPDVASTGNLLHELALELSSQGFEVEVLTGRPSYGPPETWVECPLDEVDNGVRIRRLKVARFDKNNLVLRAWNYLTFVVPMLFNMLFKSRKDTVYLYTTNPPFLGIIGWFVSRFRTHHYVVLLHDAHPKIGVLIGKFKEGSLIVRVWEYINKLKYKGALEAIVLCKAAKELVAQTYPIDRERIHVIPNWADGDDLRPMDKHESSIAVEHGLTEGFVLLYSGNIGLYYDFDTVLDAAELLRGEDFTLVLAGGGGKKDEVERQVIERGLDNVKMLPYQPFEKLNEALNACDASLVTIARGIEGISFPSKLYTSLAVGKAIVATSEDPSELRDIVEDNGVGVWSELGDGAALAETIRGLIHDKEMTDRMGRRARALFDLNYTCPKCSAWYGEVLKLADPRYSAQETAERRAALAAELSDRKTVGDDVD